MKIDAQDKEIQELLKGAFFKIPRFQRAYSWEEDEVESFWNDIIDNDDTNYFIGSVVAYVIEKPMVGLVDGQQRFTTITIMLAAIREKFKEFEERELALGVQNYIESQDADNNKKFILAPETSYPYFQREIQKYDPVKIIQTPKDIGFEETKIQEAYELIKLLIEKHLETLNVNQQSDSYRRIIIDKLKEIRSKILKLKLVYILLENETDAYLIFETLNARGKELNMSDLVKNLLLKNLPHSYEGYDESQSLWQILVDKFGSLRDKKDKTILDQYLYHYWNATRDSITLKKLFPEIKKSLGDQPQECQIFLKDIVESSEYYLNILEPDTIISNANNYNLIQSLKNLHDIKVQIVYPLLLTLFMVKHRDKISTRLLRNFVTNIEKFHIQFNGVCRRKTGGTLTKLYNETAQNLYNVENEQEANKIFNEFRNSLKRLAVSEEEFILNYAQLEYDTKNLKRKNIIKISLFMLLNNAPNNPFKGEYNDMTIEHLVSQSSKSDSMPNIGNLILVGAKLNNEKLKNLDVKEKLKILEEHKYPIEESYLNTDWNGSQAEIGQRAIELARAVYQLTKIQS